MHSQGTISFAGEIFGLKNGFSCWLYWATVLARPQKRPKLLNSIIPKKIKAWLKKKPWYCIIIKANMPRSYDPIIFQKEKRKKIIEFLKEKYQMKKR